MNTNLPQMVKYTGGILLNKEKLNFEWISYTMEGDMYVNINDVPYLYYMDAAYIEHFLRLHKKARGKALTFLKAKAKSCRKL